MPTKIKSLQSTATKSNPEFKNPSGSSKTKDALPYLTDEALTARNKALQADSFETVTDASDLIPQWIDGTYSLNEAKSVSTMSSEFPSVQGFRKSPAKLVHSPSDNADMSKAHREDGL